LTPLVVNLDFQPADFCVLFARSPHYRLVSLSYLFDTCLQRANCHLVTRNVLLSTLAHFRPRNLRERIALFFRQPRFVPLKNLMVLLAPGGEPSTISDHVAQFLSHSGRFDRRPSKNVFSIPFGSFLIRSSESSAAISLPSHGGATERGAWAGITIFGPISDGRSHGQRRSSTIRPIRGPNRDFEGSPMIRILN
jgi:hypothetical protein